MKILAVTISMGNQDSQRLSVDILLLSRNLEKFSVLESATVCVGVQELCTKRLTCADYV